MSIGNKLSQLRKQRNFSESQIAQKLDISEFVYNQYETDEKTKYRFAQKISEIYDIELFDLFKSEGSISFYHSKIEATNLINQNSVINQHLPEKIFSIYEERISELKKRLDILQSKQGN